jgi:hypothetical protein
MVQATSIIKALATTAAITAATLTGGPAAGASVAAFLASPPGQKVLDASLEQTARNQGVVLEELAQGGLVSRPTLGLTGEAGPEYVFPLGPMPTLPKKKRSAGAKRSDKLLSKAFKTANARYRLKNGQLRKGRTQADIARLAQKLRKKMSKK